jgi:hypothetical protein
MQRFARSHLHRECARTFIITVWAGVLECSIIVDLLHDIGSYLWAVCAHWQALVTGGFVVALMNLYERWKRKDIPFRQYLVVVFVFLQVAFFMTWRDEHRHHLGAAAALHTIQDKLATDRPDFVGEVDEFVAGDSLSAHNGVLGIVLEQF